MINFYRNPKELPFEAESEPTLEAYMARKYRSLGNDFNTEAGMSDICSLISYNIAFSLIEAGRDPTIGKLQGVKTKYGEWVGTERLIPKRYDGRVVFSCHFVCICDGEVYDPMVSETAVPINKYLELAFTNEDITFEPHMITTESIKKQLEKEKS